MLAAGAALWRLWGLLAPLFSRLGDREATDHRVRALLATMVQAEPGIHMEELRRRLGLGRGQVLHHLDVLERHGVIVKSNPGRYLCYYPDRESAEHLGAVVPLLKTERARRLLEMVEASPGIPVPEAERAAGVARGHLDYHVERLAAAHLLEVRKEKGRRRLFPTEMAMNLDRETVGNAEA
ncbi:MAG TPA: winged helix-turn-helix transcriptional regulator [Candidatus Thermoplasmatota archaeon]|nr:winged helix-turn-helix transcriptional regulator [Candidatus Thermoplasmatota archaeon]